MTTKPYQIPNVKQIVDGASPARGTHKQETIKGTGSPVTPSMGTVGGMSARQIPKK